MYPCSITDTLALSNAIEIPQLGFGVYQSPPKVCINSCLTALKCGYRHIDTAQYYENENEVGDAVRQSGIPRKDIFLTTKFLFDATGNTYQKCIDSVDKVDPETGYVDLFLIHAVAKNKSSRKEMWQVLEKLYHEGKARSIGVSNYGIKYIEEMKEYAKVWPPHVNQIELHPWLQQKEIVAYCKENGIIIEAYCPIVRNQKAKDDTLLSIAQKHSVTPTNILIRYSLQKGWVPLPKSDTPDRIKTNGEVFSFHLDQGDMKILDGLDQGTAGSICFVVDN